MSDYLKLADAALAEFEARRRYEKNELNEKSPSVQGGDRPEVKPGQRIILLAVPEGVPADWFEGVRQIMTHRAPSGIPPERWIQTQTDTWALLRDYGATAAHLGWTALDLFGGHPAKPLTRLDCMGLALILQGRALISLDANSALIGPGVPPLVHRRRIHTTEAIPIWEKLCASRSFEADDDGDEEERAAIVEWDGQVRPT